jgi:hypothetical protein
VIKGLQEHGHLDARPATELLELIAGLRYRPINLGIVPAANVIVLDIDPRNGGPETLRSLEARYGPLPETLGVYTGRCRPGTVEYSEHRWFRVERATGNGSSVRRFSSIGPGLDIKTADGLLVAPPSIHLDGWRYAWHKTKDGQGKCLPPTMCPPWLDEITQHPKEISGGAGSRTVSRAADGALAREMAGTPVGELSLTFYRLACWALEADDDIDALRMAARAAGLNERKIASQLAGAQRKVRGTRW